MSEDQQPMDSPARMLTWSVTLRQAMPYAIAGLMLWLLSGRLQGLDLSELMVALRTVGPGQWGLAVLATATSFWAVGRYDAVVLRQLGHQFPCGTARRAGMAAIAISQTVGMGMVTGALVRWRLLPGISLWQATRLSLAVALTFLAGWSVVASAVLLVAPSPVAALRPIAGLVLAITAALAVSCLIQPRLGPAAAAKAAALLPQWCLSIQLPPLLTSARIVALAAIDTGAAALAFYFLMPATVEVPLLVLVPAFLLALGAGLVSGTPGGVGPFEMTLLALLPTTPEAPLLAAVLAFRLVYYALPAILGGGVLLFGVAPDRTRHSTPRQPVSFGTEGPVLPTQPGSGPAQLMARAKRAEVNLVGQNTLRLHCPNNTQTGWILAETGQSLVTLGDPLGQAPLRRALAQLRCEAQRQDRSVVHYKCSARMAATARAAGYAVIAVGQEAWLRPASFDLAKPAHGQLRRKLRKAERAGLLIRAVPDQRAICGLPLADMVRVSRHWTTSHGGERGFSMGRFAPEHLAGQRIYLGFVGRRLAGFMTFHVCPTEWALDLMRHDDTLPDGGMHALLVEAIADAARAGLPRLSLAAVPSAATGSRHADVLRRLLDRATGAGGLRQFKAAFAPNWEPLYLAAPSLPALLIGGLDIAREIAFPRHVPGKTIAPVKAPDTPESLLRHGGSIRAKVAATIMTGPS